MDIASILVNKGSEHTSKYTPNQQHGKRADNNDETVPIDKAGKHRLGAVQRAEEVDIHYPAKHLGAGFGKGASLGDAGVVDEHVHAAESFNQRRDCFFTVAFLGDIAGKAVAVYSIGFQLPDRGCN